MNLVLLETSGNQRYIFATNKLRENVGASELTYSVGTRTVLKAVNKILFNEDDLSGQRLRANLLNETKNPPLGVDGNQIEVIVATSGKAILLVDDDDDKTISKRIIRDVTTEALREMPGLTIHGKISSGFDNLDARAKEGTSLLHQAVVEVHQKLEGIRDAMPGNAQRFLRLPFVAPCNTSGLPAKVTDKDGAKEVLLSEVSIYKKNASVVGCQRLEAVIHSVNEGIKVLKNPDQLERTFEGLSWLAVIHADGNGLGEIFIHFDQHSGLRDGECTGRDYLNQYRKFSIALDICTINAAGRAMGNLQKRFLAEEAAKEQRQDGAQRDEKFIPIVPLVLGGDDLTVLCDGQYALKFAHDFLQGFEAETSLSHERVGNIVSEIAQRAFGVPKLGICAGLAIVKPHFPFHQAYELAASLLDSAKLVKRNITHQHKGIDVSTPSSALDYHILYDSTASKLSAIREKLQVDDAATWLYARPYVVSKLAEGVSVNDWLRPRLWNELEKRVAAMLERNEQDDNKRQLPNSQLHALREALFWGRLESEAHANLVKHRYKTFAKLLWTDMRNKQKLFFDEPHDKPSGHTTHFLDALDIVEFRKGEKSDGYQLTDK